MLYEVDSCVHGFQDTWTPLVGEELHCEGEENIHDCYHLFCNTFAIDSLAFLMSFVVNLGGVSQCLSVLLKYFKSHVLIT